MNDPPIPKIRRELAGLRTVVLGSSSGIGRSTVLALAEAGSDVIVHGRSRHEAAEEVARSCRERFGVRAEVLMADLSNRVAGDCLVDAAWDLWGGLDAWLHFAGADVLTGLAGDLGSDAKLDQLLAVDVVSTIRLTRKIGYRMKARGRGMILTMGWDQAETGMEGDSPGLFAATKGAVMSFTRSLALDLAPEVRVNNIAPGWIQTAWGESAPEAWHQRVLRETPLKRWGTPDDVARVARWLVGPEAAFLTGQTVRVNGGAVRL